MKEEPNAFLRVEKGRIEGYRESDMIHLRTDVIILGRFFMGTPHSIEDPDIMINDDYISRDHISIYYSYDERAFLVQEREGGTTNGTFINDRQIQPGKPSRLKDGDVISLAKVGVDYQIIFRFRESETTLPATETNHRSRGLIVDLDARRGWVNGREIPLRKKEYDLLAFLYKNQGMACSRYEITENVWAEEGGVVSNETVDQNIHRIRKYIEEDPSNPQHLKTLHNYGYRLDLWI